MFHPKGPTFTELARQALSSTERGYDLLAPKFGFTPYRTPDVLVAGCLTAALGPGARSGEGDVEGDVESRAEPVERALDVCCGTGAGLLHLAPRTRDLLCGVDFSAGMLAEARRALAAAPPACRTALVRADVRAMPLTGGFDLATCFGALGHFVARDEDAFLDGVSRALVPGGRFVFLTGLRPRPLGAAWWRSRLFNGAMHVRNALWPPPFIMFYLRFLWPDVEPLLRRHGLRAEARELPGGPSRYRAVVARKA